MSPLLDLLLLCSVMSVTTFLFGVLPLALRLSRLTLRILEVGGAGLLLGAACSVVMPEGAGTLFRQPKQQHQHDHEKERRHSESSLKNDPETMLAVSFLAGVLIMYIIDQVMAPGPHVHTHDPAPQDTDVDHHHHHHEGHHPHRRFSAPRHDPPTRDCPEERPFRRLTRPETLHLTRSSLHFDSYKDSFANLRDSDSKSILHSDSTSAVQDDIHKTKTSSRHSHSESLRDHSPASSQGSLPADYHTIPHDDGTQSFKSQSTVGRADWRRAGRSEEGGRPSQDPSSSSPLLHSPPRSPPRHQARLSQQGRRMSSSSPHSSSEKARGLRAAFTSVIGLVIHAACDGIAMGASSASHDEGLKLVVVAAIMIHKAPAAFGLCTLLLSQRLSRNDVRKAMAIFSLATPVGALLTYIILNTLLNSATAATPSTLQQSVSPSQVGSALTFSAGSFIYVALHAVHELASPSSDYENDFSTSDHDHSSSSRSITHTVVPKQTLGRFGRVVVLLVGAILPRGLQLIFGHGH